MRKLLQWEMIGSQYMLLADRILHYLLNLLKKWGMLNYLK